MLGGYELKAKEPFGNSTIGLASNNWKHYKGRIPDY